MSFEFATAARILFGAGTARQLPALAAEMGKRALLVLGGHPERHAATLDSLKAAGVAPSPYQVRSEPTTEEVAAGCLQAVEHRCDLVIAIGGGSVLDAGKAIAALVTNGGEPLDYLEVIGRGQALTHPSLPFVAVPTTAGTGSEVTRNAVLASPQHGVKVSLRSTLLLPRLALVDPELTYTTSREVTASAGMDALTQLIEPFTCTRANAMVDGIAREGLRRAARSLRRAYFDGQDAAAREDMSLASMLSGLALANAGLGAVHGLAGPIGGMFAAPHGAVCARLLPAVMAANVRALRAGDPAGDGLRRMEEVARMLTGDDRASAEAGAAWAEELCAALGIPPLSAYGLGSQHVAALAEKAVASVSMKTNPVPLTREEIQDILLRAI